MSSVVGSLAEAAEVPQANPWFRAVYADGQPVGFVMVAWNVDPQPPGIIGPWFLWKLLIDHRHQRLGYGHEVIRQIVELVRSHGATELLTSYALGDGSPAGFYESRLPTDRSRRPRRRGPRRPAAGWFRAHTSALKPRTSAVPEAGQPALRHERTALPPATFD